MAKKVHKNAVKTATNPKTTTVKPKDKLPASVAKRYLDFLTELWTLSKKGGSFTFTPLIRKHGVSPKVSKAILAGDWVIKLDGAKYRWTANKPNASTVKIVLDCFNIDKKPIAEPDTQFKKLLSDIEAKQDELSDLVQSPDDMRLDELVAMLNGSLNETLQPVFLKKIEEPVSTDPMTKLLEDFEKLQADYLVLEDKLNNPSERIDELVAHHNRFSTLESQLVVISNPLFEDINNKLYFAVKRSTDLEVILESNHKEFNRISEDQKTRISELEHIVTMLHSNLEVAEDTINIHKFEITKLTNGLDKIKNLGIMKIKKFFNPKWFENIFN